MIDLHTHTTESDGDFSPERVVELAEKEGLGALCVSDHDTLEGSRRAIAKGSRTGMEIIPGLEMSTSFRGSVLHVLGYFIDLENVQLEEALRNICAYRKERATSIIQNINRELNAEGSPEIELEKVLKLGKEKPLTRPDIAGFLVRHGYVEDKNEAFEKWLNKYNIPNKSFSAKDAAHLIHEAGGIAVLAHPFSAFLSLRAISDSFDEQRQMVRELHDDGIDGLEVYRYGVREEDLQRNEKLARDFGMVVSGGSDFHGPGNSKNAQKPGACNAPDRLLEEMREYARCRDQSSS